MGYLCRLITCSTLLFFRAIEDWSTTDVLASQHSEKFERIGLHQRAKMHATFLPSVQGVLARCSSSELVLLCVLALLVWVSGRCFPS